MDKEILKQGNILKEEIEFLENIIVNKDKLLSESYINYNVVKITLNKLRRFLKVKIKRVEFSYEINLTYDQFLQINKLLNKFIDERYNKLTKEFKKL